MPLESFNDYFDRQLEGFYFGMKDQNNRGIKVRLDRSALDDYVRGVGDEQDFRNARSVVELLASAKYDAGDFNNELVVISSRDLNPEQYR